MEIMHVVSAMSPGWRREENGPRGVIGISLDGIIDKRWPFSSPSEACLGNSLNVGIFGVLCSRN